MRTTGLTHLSAVSGANFTLVCGTVLLVLTALGAGRVPRLAVAALAAVGFVVLARPEPSVLRAAAMGLVGLVGLAGSRRAAGVPALAVAVVLLCVLDPWLSRSAGFALSVLATGGLLLLAGPWTRTLARALPLWAAAAVAVPLAAQAVCSPVTVLLTPQLSLVAVPANVLVAPAVAPGHRARRAWPRCWRRSGRRAPPGWRGSPGGRCAGSRWSRAAVPTCRTPRCRGRRASAAPRCWPASRCWSPSRSALAVHRLGPAPPRGRRSVGACRASRSSRRPGWCCARSASGPASPTPSSRAGSPCPRRGRAGGRSRRATWGRARRWWCAPARRPRWWSTPVRTPTWSTAAWTTSASSGSSCWRSRTSTPTTSPVCRGCCAAARSTPCWSARCPLPRPAPAEVRRGAGGRRARGERAADRDRPGAGSRRRAGRGRGARSGAAVRRLGCRRRRRPGRGGQRRQPGAARAHPDDDPAGHRRRRAAGAARAAGGAARAARPAARRRREPGAPRLGPAGAGPVRRSSAPGSCS